MVMKLFLERVDVTGYRTLFGYGVVGLAEP